MTVLLEHFSLQTMYNIKGIWVLPFYYIHVHSYGVYYHETMSSHDLKSNNYLMQLDAGKHGIKYDIN